MISDKELKPILEKYFGELSAESFKEILGMLEFVNIPGNRVLVQQGDPGDSMFILVQGRLQAEVETPNGPPKIIGEVTRGESVGEMALFTGDPRSATIYSLRDSILLRINKPTFDLLIRKFPTCAVELSKLIIQRYNRPRKKKSLHPVVNIALIPLSPTVDIAAFTRQLETSLSKFGQTVVLQSNSVAEQSGIEGAHRLTEGDPKNVSFTGWLENQETAFDFVLYQSDHEFNIWSRRCMRQADRILLVADATQNPQPGQLETEWLPTEFPGKGSIQELILLHPADTRMPSNTRSWLQPRNIDQFHHLRMGNLADTNRLVRFLSGNAIGLVLGGGGAKGYAHIGVIKAMRELNIPVDAVCGASIGALFAASVSTEMDTNELIDSARKGFTKKSPLGDYNFYPIASLSKGLRLNELLHGAFGEQEIEDQWISFFCTASNLSTSELIIFRKGSLWKAIRASLSIPGILPPMVDGNHLLVDGGVLNNLPANIMRDAGIGRIITVDLELTQSYQLTYKKMPSTSTILRSRWLPWVKRLPVPGLTSTIWKSMIMGSGANRKEAIAATDLYLNPPLAKFGLMNWKALDTGIQSGYDHAQKVFAENPQVKEWF